VLDDDPTDTRRLAGDPIAVDEYGTATVGVNGGTIGVPVDPIPADVGGDELDPRKPSGGTVDDPDRPPRRA
jgi:hypothetical protein